MTRSSKEEKIKRKMPLIVILNIFVTPIIASLVGGKIAFETLKQVEWMEPIIGGVIFGCFSILCFTPITIVRWRKLQK